MNKQQRAKIAAACASLQPYTDSDTCLLNGPQATFDAMEAAKSIFTEMAEEEREKFDNMPEGLQQGERGQDMETAADALESAADELDGTDLKDGVTPDADWEIDAANVVENAIEHAESF